MTKPRRSSALTEIQEQFVDAKLLGLSDRAAAAAISGNSNGSLLAASERVKEELAKAREKIIDLTTLKRLDVIEGIMDTIEMGRMMADPVVMQRGWVEIAKILGHYAPEVKRIEVTMSQGRIRDKFEALTDEELLAIVERKTIEGEFTKEQHHE